MHDLIAAHHTNDLDNPAYAALTSVHSRFAQRNGSALRYIPATVRFLALPTSPSPADWRDAAELVEPDGPLAIIGARCEPPQDWRIIRQFDVVQMLEHDITGTEHPGAVSLSPADVPEMLELVRLTNPGPFDDRTVELGDYVGVRDADALVAMVGERLRFTGWTEISAVCTVPGHRGQGLASRLVTTLVAGIHRRQERALLHVVTANTDAIRLYERLGFHVRRGLTIAVIAPGRG